MSQIMKPKLRKVSPCCEIEATVQLARWVEAYNMHILQNQKRLYEKMSMSDIPTNYQQDSCVEAREMMSNS